MVALLAKWFIKEKPDANNARTRHLYGVLCSVCGIALNLLLVVGKLVVGSLSGSIAITADALNNLSDVGSSLITLLGFKIARQKPDQEHPFGHGRIEYVAGLLVAVIILIMGFELIKTSVEKIITPQPVSFSSITVVVLAAAILVKLYMAYYNRRIGRVIDSASMRATALDSLSDVGATSAVLLSMVIGNYTGLPIDGWCGVLVSLLIMAAGISTFKDTVSLLLGEPPKHEYIGEIKAIVLAHPEIIGVHDLMVHDYGPGRRIITLHAEVSASGDMLTLHDAVDNAEKELHEQMGCTAIIHMDPIDTDDALTDETRRRVSEVIKGLDERATIHDFRMVSGPTHTNLIFDVSVSFDVKATDTQLTQRVAHMVHALDDSFFAVITVDRVGEGME